MQCSFYINVTFVSQLRQILTKEEFKNIFDVYFDEVRNYIFYRCGDDELATDIAQDTFLKFWEKQFDISEGKFKGLLFKISSDLFTSHYRKMKTHQNFAFQVKPEYIVQTPEELLQFEEMQKSLDKALLSMPEKQRVVFFMHRMDHLKYHEIAELLGLSVKAVEKRMKLGLDFLRKNIIR